jgi:general secretion pathway protein N
MPGHAKRNALLVVLGVGALLAFALATLPASVAGGRLARLGFEAAEFSGSVWTGSASGLAWRGSPLGDLQWQLSPAALLRGHLAGHAALARADGSVDTRFDLGWTGEAALSDTSFALPVEVLSDLPIGMPHGWRGRVSGKLDEVVVRHGWPTRLRGAFDMDGLVTPPPRNSAIGSYHVVMPHPKPTHEGSLPDYLTAKVTDKDGPFSVDGQLAVGKDRSFLFEGGVAVRGNVPEAMRQSLEMLGPPDAAGRRPFTVSGTL